MRSGVRACGGRSGVRLKVVIPSSVVRKQFACLADVIVVEDEQAMIGETDEGRVNATSHDGMVGVGYE